LYVNRTEKRRKMRRFGWYTLVGETCGDQLMWGGFVEGMEEKEQLVTGAEGHWRKGQRRPQLLWENCIMGGPRSSFYVPRYQHPRPLEMCPVWVRSSSSGGEAGNCLTAQFSLPSHTRLPMTIWSLRRRMSLTTDSPTQANEYSSLIRPSVVFLASFEWCHWNFVWPPLHYLLDQSLCIKAIDYAG